MFGNCENYASTSNTIDFLNYKLYIVVYYMHYNYKICIFIYEY